VARTPWISLGLAVAAVAGLGGCGHPAATAPPLHAEPPPPPAPKPARLDEPALPKRLLDIAWDQVALADDAAALALWTKIAPTGDDWEDKVLEIPTDKPVARALALALLRQGNFACRPLPAPPRSCAHHPIDLPPPASTATIDDPCLRRLLALWAVGQLDPGDLPGISDALTAIAALPPPESELTEVVLSAIPEAQPELKLKLIATAAAAGQHELADAAVGALDEAQLALALRRDHIDGALTGLSPQNDRGLFLQATADDKLRSKTRVQVIHELVALEDKLAPDSKAALIAAAKGADCAVAATAARLLEQDGDKRFVPTRPRTQKPAELMHALCVLVSYDEELSGGERSPLRSYVPPRGLEVVHVTYDPDRLDDADGDGDPHTEHTLELVPAAEVSLPEADELAHALTRCEGLVCKSDEHEFRFTLKPGAGGLVLARIEVVDRPACE
jgi:hypothetical protein